MVSVGCDLIVESHRLIEIGENQRFLNNYEGLESSRENVPKILKIN